MNAPRIDWNAVEHFKLKLPDVELLQRAGVLDGHRVELIEGVLIAVSPQYRPHSFLKNEMTKLFWQVLETLKSPLSAQSEVTVEISPETAPEPDIVLTDAPMGDGYVPVSSLALAVEIADSSLRRDLGEKRDIYASAKIPEYWVVDVEKRMVHRFADPEDGEYRAEPPIPLAGPLQSLTMPDLMIDGSGIL